MRLFPCVGVPADDEGRLAAAGGLYNAAALQGWLLACCQQASGGLRDKPGKRADYYHTCYCLSGLSSAQHYGGAGLQVLGDPRNELERAHPVVNVTARSLAAWRATAPWPVPEDASQLQP